MTWYRNWYHSYSYIPVRPVIPRITDTHHITVYSTGSLRNPHGNTNWPQQLRENSFKGFNRMSPHDAYLVLTEMYPNFRYYHRSHSKAVLAFEILSQKDPIPRKPRWNTLLSCNKDNLFANVTTLKESNESRWSLFNPFNNVLNIHQLPFSYILNCKLQETRI